MVSIFKQRLVGLFVFLGGVGFTYFTWITAINEGIVYSSATICGPAFAIIGLGMFFFPMDRSFFMEKYGVDRPVKLSHLPPIWWCIMIAAIGSGSFYLNYLTA